MDGVFKDYAKGRFKYEGIVEVHMTSPMPSVIAINSIVEPKRFQRNPDAKYKVTVLYDKYYAYISFHSKTEEYLEKLLAYEKSQKYQTEVPYDVGMAFYKAFAMKSLEGNRLKIAWNKQYIQASLTNNTTRNTYGEVRNNISFHDDIIADACAAYAKVHGITQISEPYETIQTIIESIKLLSPQSE
jgi:hypothetical protein